MYYKTGNITLYYEKYGNAKQSIVILPGWGNTRKTFSYLIEQLKEDNTIYIMDYPGFGESPILITEWNMDDYALLIKNFLYENNIYNPIIIAHSFGVGESLGLKPFQEYPGLKKALGIIEKARKKLLLI